MTAQAEKDVVLASLDHAKADITSARTSIVDWSVDDVIVVPPVEDNAATFLAEDLTTQGNWQGVYGGDGYNIPAETIQQPSYVVLAPPTGSKVFHWQVSPEPYALQKPGGNGRCTGVWLGNTISFLLDVGATARKLALYFWDAESTSREMKVDILDGTKILATATALGYNSGKWETFSVKGKVEVRVTKVTGQNGTLSGLFLHTKDEIPVSPGDSALAELAASLVPGTWGELESENINESLSDPLSPNTTLVFHYCNSVTRDAAGMNFVGADHGGGPGLSRYDEASNSWSDRLPCIGSHGYQWTATSPEGVLYRVMCGTSPGLFVIAPDGTSELFMELPEDFQQYIAHGALFWWKGKGLGLYTSNFGNFYIGDVATKQWTQAPPLNTGQLGYYHSVAAYSEKFNCAVMGGGYAYSNDPDFSPDNRKLWRVDADMSSVPMPDAPHPVGIYSGMNIVAGPDGMIYALGYHDHWQLNPSGLGTWTQLTAPPADMLMPNDHQAVFSCCTPYGVVVITGKRADAKVNCRMYLYKPL